MIRMLKMEFVLFGQYMRQLAFTTLFMAVCFSAGMGSTTSLPAIVFMMAMFSLTTSANHYDEQGQWAALRLSMPLSRRDVVLGRYAFVLVGALMCALGVAAFALVLGAAAEFAPLPDMVGSIVALDADKLMAGTFTLALCGVMGVTVASVCMPVFFKFGATKATQWLPFVMMFLGVMPIMLVGFMGEEALAAAGRMMAFVETPSGLAAFCTGALVAAALLYAASCVVSLHIYRCRDL